MDNNDIVINNIVNNVGIVKRAQRSPTVRSRSRTGQGVGKGKGKGKGKGRKQDGKRKDTPMPVFSNPDYTSSWSPIQRRREGVMMR